MPEESDDGLATGDKYGEGVPVRVHRDTCGTVPAGGMVGGRGGSDNRAGGIHVGAVGLAVLEAVADIRDVPVVSRTVCGDAVAAGDTIVACPVSGDRHCGGVGRSDGGLGSIRGQLPFCVPGSEAEVYLSRPSSRPHDIIPNHTNKLTAIL